uniref:Uncharacterized protein n=1 Tax=Otus sunia TaxID=257818 RepID=A0A8C8AQ11_9STRI
MNRIKNKLIIASCTCPHSPLQEGALRSRSSGNFISFAMVSQQSLTQSKRTALRQQTKEHLKNPKCRVQYRSGILNLCVCVWFLGCWGFS